MKKLFELLFLLFIFVLVVTYRNEIHAFIMDNVVYRKEPFETQPNNYTLNYENNYVSQTNNFVAQSQQDVLNIFYTYLNNGEDHFYFFCDYDNCIKDINTFTHENMFVNINNFVHPFNTYNRLYISSTSWGKVQVSVDKTYSIDEITQVNNKIHNIIDEIIADDMTDKEKIKTFHDYIINHTKYDIEYINSGITDLNNPSHKAVGILNYSKALCGGYSHTMSVFLNILKIPNYRISSDTHIWNLVYLDNNWYHLDLTWDDPVVKDGSDILIDKYFLISSDKLSELNTGVHEYNKEIYKETITQ